MAAMVGGSSAAEVDDTIRGLVSDHKAKIEEAAGEQYEALEPIQATKQVAGLNYRLKLKTGADSCIHVVIYDRFGDVSVTSVDKNVSMDSPL